MLSAFPHLESIPNTLATHQIYILHMVTTLYVYCIYIQLLFCVCDDVSEHFIHFSYTLRCTSEGDSVFRLFAQIDINQIILTNLCSIGRLLDLDLHIRSVSMGWIRSSRKRFFFLIKNGSLVMLSHGAHDPVWLRWQLHR